MISPKITFLILFGKQTIVLEKRRREGVIPPFLFFSTCVDFVSRRDSGKCYEERGCYLFMIVLCLFFCTSPLRRTCKTLEGLSFCMRIVHFFFALPPFLLYFCFLRGSCVVQSCKGLVNFFFPRATFFFWCRSLARDQEIESHL